MAGAGQILERYLGARVGVAPSPKQRQHKVGASNTCGDVQGCFTRLKELNHAVRRCAARLARINPARTYAVVHVQVCAVGDEELVEFFVP